MIAGMNGDDIKRLREQRGLTQPQLAALLGVGPRTISNWETGATVPKNRLGMLYAFFGVEAEESADPIRNAPDVTLLAELLRRAAARDNGGTQ